MLPTRIQSCSPNDRSMNRFDLDFITHRRISDNRLVSLILMAMLAFALTSLRAQSSATNTAAPVAALTPELMNKMLRLIALKGTDKELNPKVANEPGLATPWLGVMSALMESHQILSTASKSVAEAIRMS